jgi:hypothetical protein
MRLRIVKEMVQKEFGTHATIARVNLGDGYSYQVYLGSKIIGQAHGAYLAFADAKETMNDPALLASLGINLFCEACGRHSALNPTPTGFTDVTPEEEEAQ